MDCFAPCFTCFARNEWICIRINGVYCFVTDEVYTLPFRVVMASLAAVGVILTPIYLLSMLRIFFGKENPKLTEERKLIDAEPRKFILLLVYFCL